MFIAMSRISAFTVESVSVDYVVQQYGQANRLAPWLLRIFTVSDISFGL